MEFKLEINMDNAAFEVPEYELVRILKAVSAKIDSRGLAVGKEKILDVNGNSVGHYEVIDEDGT